MPRSLLVLAAAALGVVCASSAPAQTDPSAVADLAAIRQKAEASPGALRTLDEIVRMISQRQDQAGPDYVLRLVFGQTGIGSRGQLPVNIGAIERRPAAISRAQYLSQILMADLDNDWSVTREELTYVLEVPGGGNSAADLFLLGDKDGNNILTLDEIKAVVTARADADTSNRRNPLSLSLFDFDGDGQFTQQEFDRAVKALSQ